MTSRLDRALDLLERIVRAAERIAEAAERGDKPPRTSVPPRPTLHSKRARTLTDEEVRARARQRLIRAGALPR